MTLIIGSRVSSLSNPISLSRHALIFNTSNFPIHSLYSALQYLLLPTSMQNTSNRRFTCRYWALGPSCPDGVLCQYAHRVTGQVASPTLQPGTCLSFSKSGYCPKLRALCGYEHRHTGVTGLYQGSKSCHSDSSCC